MNSHLVRKYSTLKHLSAALNVNNLSSAFKKSLFGVLLVAGVPLLSPAQAQVPHEVIVGRTAGGDTTLVASTDYLRFYGDAGSSYSCEILAVNAGANGFLNSPVRVIADNGTGATTLITPRACGFDNPRVGSEVSRFCFVLPATVSFPEVQIDLGWTGAYPANVRLACDETTLYSGFNTSVTNFNFLELTSTLDRATTQSFVLRDLTATITAINTLPAIDVVVIDGTTVTIPANSRTDVDVHTAAGTGVFGPVKIAHNGAPGSLKAVVSQYNITSTSPLTFAPVAQEVAVTRGQLAGINR